MPSQGIVGIMLGIVIGLSLVATVATSTTSASTALAPFSGAQALVIIVPLIFVAIILLYAYSHAGTQKGGGRMLIFRGMVERVRIWMTMGMIRRSWAVVLIYRD